MHQSSGRWQLGLLLSLITALLWGMLPIALKGLLQTMDATSITWYRFVVALVVTAVFLIKSRKLPNLKWLKQKKRLGLFAVVIFGLCGNYILYLMGLSFVTPSAAQVMIQLAPLLLLVGGLVIFGERFNIFQWTGLFLFLVGLALFFNHRFEAIFGGDSAYGFGLFLIVLAAVLWAAYALAQKQLLMHYSSQQIMFIVYFLGSLMFLPGSSVGIVIELSGLQWALLIFCCLNTLVAYGSFAEALAHWEASRVSAVLAITPLMTMLFATITSYFFPGYLAVEDFNWLSILGGFILVVGATTAALARSKKVR